MRCIILDKQIQEIQDVIPEYRIGQAICNSLGVTCPELFYIKDQDLINKIQQHIDIHFKELK